MRMRGVMLGVLLGVVAGVYDPVADAGAVVTLGKARFTVLTERLIRMEYAKEAGVWEDSATQVVLNRALGVPQYTVEQGEDHVTIATDYVTLTYAPGNAGESAFSAENLKATVHVAGSTAVWTPGAVAAGNLFGTMRTLDYLDGWQSLDCDAFTTENYCTYGLVSTDGWVVVNDTGSRLLDQGEPVQWLVERESHDAADWYLFAHGHDYKQALYDFTLIAGKVPIPPRYSFGIFYSRYWNYNDRGYKDIVKQYEMYQVPLDVFVTDMDWHLTFYKAAHNGTKDQAGQKIGWTGLTWDRRQFPYPERFMAWCKAKGLRNTLNLHPASGVQPFEDVYEDMATAMGIDPATQVYVPYNLTDKKFADNYMNIALKPIVDTGVDFWWLDWQQWLEGNPNPTWWLNHVMYNFNKWYGRALRGMVLHRYGGLGNHRYQVGFSGSVPPTWESLNYQPYFTFTAANVLFGYWSHDIGGHNTAVEAELYTRWAQWGALSPMFRPHSGKDTDNDRRIWIFPYTNFRIMRDAHVFRSQLVPYLYTEAFYTYETAVAAVHPMYYEYPEITAAYSKTQYMFGSHMMAAPVTQKGDNATGTVTWDIWIPEGRWVEWGSNAIFEGPQTVSRVYDLDEVPLFVKAGSIITLLGDDRPLFGSAQRQYDSLLLSIFPTPYDEGREAELYEDDGLTEDYMNGAYTIQKMRYGLTSLTEMAITIDAVQGTFEGAPASRKYAIQLNGVMPASGVTVDGVALDATAYTFEGNDLTLRIEAGTLATATKHEIVVTFAEELRDTRGFARCSMRAEKVKELLDEQWGKKVYIEDYYDLLEAVETGERMNGAPTTVVAELEQFWTKLESSVATMTNYAVLEEDVRARAVELLSTC